MNTKMTFFTGRYCDKHLKEKKILGNRQDGSIYFSFYFTIHIVINDYVYLCQHSNVIFENKHSECNLLATYHSNFSFT